MKPADMENVPLTRCYTEGESCEQGWSGIGIASTTDLASGLPLIGISIVNGEGQAITAYLFPSEFRSFLGDFTKCGLALIENPKAMETIQ